MSKKAKETARAIRRARKSARKAAQNVQYAAWKVAGQNTKSRRAKLRKRRARQVRNNEVSHPCGNIGCKHCNPEPHNLLPLRLLAAA